MGIKKWLAKPLAKKARKRIDLWAHNPVETQDKVMRYLIDESLKTKFGKDHNFESIEDYSDFKKQIPLVDYEGLRSYVDLILEGEPDVLWKGKPIYLAKTSGTTSGAKYIPLTKESMPTHIQSAKDALLLYVAETGDSTFVDGKMIFLQGSPVLEEIKGIKLGRLSGISAHYVPSFLQRNRMPSWETNCIEDWETKVNAVVEETYDQDMRLISGIPSWVQMYFEKLIDKTGKSIAELYPNFNLFVYGGVNFEPYKKKFESLIGKKVNYIELYPASEGFIALQDKQEEEGMLLQLDSGIFYEFVEAKDYGQSNAKRISIADVKLGVNYALILNTNAGLWGYSIGDTVMFTSINPYRLKVTGRIKHFISAFGEHVIGKEVEQALKVAVENSGAIITEFTVAPQVNPDSGLPFHEWFIEFEKIPENMSDFEKALDQSMQDQNIYYKDLIDGSVLRSAVVSPVGVNGFRNYMESIGKLGGQNKIPQLSDNRNIADGLKNFLI
jgi:phenylacetate-coenzyme A ligase PaaK-like adenylate-forming protein